MRFLLFPKKSVIATSDVGKRVGSMRKIPKRASSPNGTVWSLPESARKLPRDKSISCENNTIKRYWGQQCNENCGCVVRFQADIDNSTSRIISVGYTAKMVLTAARIPLQKNRSNGIQYGFREEDQRSPKERVVMTTAKGRPMVKECNCKTVHVISSAIVDYISNKNNHCNQWNQIYSNIINFESSRSSKPFQESVLRAQNLPPTDSACFDVVEEAITAMIKGYIPQPRQLQHSLAKSYIMRQRNYDTRYAEILEPHSSSDRNTDREYDSDQDHPNEKTHNHEQERFYRYAKSAENYDFSKYTFPFGVLYQSQGSSEVSMDRTTASEDANTRQNAKLSPMLSPLSTLELYDLSLTSSDDYDEDNEESSTFSIRDWISYIDRQ